MTPVDDTPWTTGSMVMEPREVDDLDVNAVHDDAVLPPRSQRRLLIACAALGIATSASMLAGWGASVGLAEARLIESGFIPGPSNGPDAFAIHLENVPAPDPARFERARRIREIDAELVQIRAAIESSEARRILSARHRTPRASLVELADPLEMPGVEFDPYGGTSARLRPVAFNDRPLNLSSVLRSDSKPADHPVTPAAPDIDELAQLRGRLAILQAERERLLAAADAGPAVHLHDGLSDAPSAGSPSVKLPSPASLERLIQSPDLARRHARAALAKSRPAPLGAAWLAAVEGP